MKKLLLTILFCLVSSGAWAQCNGVFGVGAVCGNNTAAPKPPTAVTGSYIIWANDLGAKCDGVTDDSAAFQTAINTAIANGFILSFHGDCIINTGLTISGGALTFQGINYFVSGLLCNVSITCITVAQTTAVFIHDFTVTTQSAPATGIGIAVGAPGIENAGTIIWNMFLDDGTPLKFANANSWTVYNNSIVLDSSTGDGIYMGDNNVDNGSDTAYGNQISSTVNGGNGIHWQSGGGVRITNNVLIGTAFNRGIFVNPTSAAVTSDIWITNNHIEGAATSNAACIEFTRTASTGFIGNIIVTNNECAGWKMGFFSPTDTGSWLQALILGNNTLGVGGSQDTSAFGYRILTPVLGLTIVGGGIGAQTVSPTTAVFLGTQTESCAVGPLFHYNQGGAIHLSASVLSTCTSYPPN